MSLRIEHTDPLALLCELPTRWAQTCITQPPRADPGNTVAVLKQTMRVLRDDGTLWLFLPHGLRLLDELRATGWLVQRKPAWVPIAWEHFSPSRLYLLTKSSHYFYEQRPFAVWTHQRPLSSSERRALLIRRCLAMSSSPFACGACGAPHHRATSRPRPGCGHNNPDGRCLVLDPFSQEHSPTAQLAIPAGRAFLGIHGRQGKRQ